MTSKPPSHKNNQYDQTNSEDELSSNNNPLINVDDQGEKIPLLNTTDGISSRDYSVLSNANPLRPDSPVSHCHVPDEKFDYSARNRLILAFTLSFTFMVIEIIGAVISKSTAIGMDATHMCIDSGSFLISLGALYLARKQPTQRLSFGYARAEILGALVSVVTIWVATGILIYIAAQRVVHQNFIVKPIEMIVVASCGVVFNIIIFFILYNDSCSFFKFHHGHSHDKNQKYNDEKNTNDFEPSKNIHIRAAMVHVVGDFIQSIGILLAAILIKINPKYRLADPICTFIFSFLVFITTITIMRDLGSRSYGNTDYTQIIDDLLRLPGVCNAHSLHIWSLSLQKTALSVQKTALSVHIAIDNERNCLKILDAAQEMLRREHSITQATIQVESYDENIVNSCETCLPLLI